MPSAFGDDSDLCRMLRLIAPQFEHRLFLSATPHNGHTRCFTGLLEILDPVRFSQTDELKPAEKERVQQVVIRRLKREINARTTPPRFCDRRPPHALRPHADAGRGRAQRGLRPASGREVKRLIGAGRRQAPPVGSFAVEILGKRLLSCPTAFAESWRRCKRGPRAERGGRRSRRRMPPTQTFERETGDDRETPGARGHGGRRRRRLAQEPWRPTSRTRSRPSTARRSLGLGLSLEPGPRGRGAGPRRRRALRRARRPRREPPALERQVARRRAPRRLHRVQDHARLPRPPAARARTSPTASSPCSAAWTRASASVVKRRVQRPRRAGPHPDRHRRRVRGPQPPADRALPAALRLPLEPLEARAAQRPPRPSRPGPRRDRLPLRQRPGPGPRASSPTSSRKADEIREDLGSANELFDEAAHRRLVEGESAGLRPGRPGSHESRPRAAAPPSTPTTRSTPAARAQPAEGRATRSTARSARRRDRPRPRVAPRHARGGHGHPRSAGPSSTATPRSSTCKLLNPGLPGWTEVVDESLRLSTASGRARPGGPPRLQPRAVPRERRRAPRLLAAPRRPPAPPLAPDAAARPSAR